MAYPFGVDISFWQKEVDFAKMMNADLPPEFIGIRAGQGTYSIDPFFASNWQQAKEKGLHRIAYHVMEFFGKGKLQAELLFDRARISRRIDLDLADSASLLLCEIVVFGRSAMGERVLHGEFVDRWRLRRGGRLVFAETIRLDGEIGEKLAHLRDLDRKAKK